LDAGRLGGREAGMLGSGEAGRLRCGDGIILEGRAFNEIIN
jgi:hypothetical protein